MSAPADVSLSGRCFDNVFKDIAGKGDVLWRADAHAYAAVQSGHGGLADEDTAVLHRVEHQRCLGVVSTAINSDKIGGGGDGL